MIQIEIIIPIFNSEETIERTLNSICSASKGFEKFKVICVDDGSKDKSLNIVKEFKFKLSNNIYLLSTGGTGLGPGIARNKGLNYCSKDSYIIFLDSDDELSENSLSIVSEKIIEYKNPELLAMNYELNESESINPVRRKKLNKGNRRDQSKLASTKDSLVTSYLKMQMDGSVIFTVFQAKFLKTEKITFRNGLHEDIDFIFNCYLKAKNLIYCDYIFYRKHSTSSSIINTFSTLHIKGYLNAWFNIYKIIKNFDFKNKLGLKEKEIESAFLTGFRGAVGVLIKNTDWSGINYGEAISYICNLIRQNEEILNLLILQNKCTFITEYDKLYEIIHNVLIQDGTST